VAASQAPGILSPGPKTAGLRVSRMVGQSQGSASSALGFILPPGRLTTRSRITYCRTVRDKNP
jgi:hypothetical protein